MRVGTDHPKQSIDALKSTQEASNLSLDPRRRHVKDGSDLI